MLHSTKKSHLLIPEAQCNCKLCVKGGPASLKYVLISYKIYSPTNKTVSEKQITYLEISAFLITLQANFGRLPNHTLSIN